MYGYCPKCKALVSETDYNSVEKMCWVCWAHEQKRRRELVRDKAEIKGIINEAESMTEDTMWALIEKAQKETGVVKK